MCRVVSIAARLRDSPTTTHCAWKGEASYFDVVLDDRVIENAAWSYQRPTRAAERIARYVAFARPVEVES